MKSLYFFVFLLSALVAKSQDYGWKTIYTDGNGSIQYRIVVHHVKYLGDKPDGWITAVYCHSTFPDDFVQYGLIADAAYPGDINNGRVELATNIGYGFCTPSNNKTNSSVNDYVSFSNIKLDYLKVGSRLIIKNANQTGNSQSPSANSGTGNLTPVTKRPYDNSDSRCINCPNRNNVVLPPVSNNDSKNLSQGNNDDDDGLSKIDPNNPQEVLKWSINKFEKLSIATKCPTTAAAYKKLVTYFRCVLNNGDCGLQPSTEIPDCPADN